MSILESPAPWRSLLSNELDRLGRWMQGRLVTPTGADGHLVTATRYTDPGYLTKAIARASAQPVVADDDLRVAVSRFTRHYAASVSAVALVGLANGLAFDVSLPRVRLSMRGAVPYAAYLTGTDEELVGCEQRPSPWSTTLVTVDTLHELRHFVWEKLYAENIALVLDRVSEVVRVSSALLWSNAAEWVGIVSDAAEEYLGPERAQPYVDDRDALLGAATLPGVAGPSPLLQRLRWVPTDEHPGNVVLPPAVHVREVCCATYLLPDRHGRLCASCPLLPDPERFALLRERHGAPIGTPGGPAERRSIELGRRRISNTGGQR